MTEMEMNNEVEAEEFTEELSDEALDRLETSSFLRVCCACSNCK